MRHGIRLSDLRGPPSDPERYQRQVAAQLDALAARRTGAKPEPHQGRSLEPEGRAALLLVDPARPVLVRIVRVGGRRLDDDNLAGGCKELRDAIAAALGRRGDSEADNLTWEYGQEPGAEAGTRIEVKSKGGCG